MIDLKDVNYVAAISRAGGIKKAAKSVGLSQPALTKRLQNLEDNLGLQLFNRTSKGVSLTQYGEVFLAEGAKLIAHATDFQNAVVNPRKGSGGIISVGIKPGIDDAFFRDSLVEFTRQFPQTHVKISINATPTLATKIKNGQLDFAIGALGYTDGKGGEVVLSDDMEFEPMFRMSLDVIVRKDHPILTQTQQLEALLQYPIACPTPPHVIMENLTQAYARQGLDLQRPHVQIDDYKMIYDLLERSDMWSAIYTPTKNREALLDKFVSLGPSPLLPPLTIGLVKRKTWAITPVADALIKIMKKHAAEWLIDPL